jgi:hypothetical protein
MTLRHALGGDARAVHEAVERILEAHDGVIVLLDRDRAITYASGFGLSACQLELVATQMERTVRAVTNGSGVRQPRSTKPHANAGRRRADRNSADAQRKGANDEARGESDVADNYRHG